MPHILDQGLKDFVSESILSFIEDGKVDLPGLCNSLGIEVFNYKFQKANISGAIERKNDKWKIFVNHKDSPRRKRFTVAHELGHYFSALKQKASIGMLPMSEGTSSHVDEGIAVMLRSANDTEAELEANEIAALLLMPETKVKEMAGNGCSIEEMADYFEVSESAMTVRVMNLGYKILEGSALESSGV